MNNLNKSCFLCGASDCNGIILNGEKICRTCEEKIVNAKVIDQDYNMYKNQIKKILFNEHA
ncbi:sigma factor G inhibitor Gin [Clostridium saccharobutylicum]|uniref:Inhibitor of sigma-G Gin n=1 Tax=Clostridium saccharobutylicum TaxID=169679 RepID=A0A1S8N473_CLOSA|nr:sigma factor G inhibitor Gin [Clostridium saccharobutylicum]OOM11193.1 inhibitor of sigma-G Gin [Clostridium saccharobutylicum]